MRSAILSCLLLTLPGLSSDEKGKQADPSPIPIVKAWAVSPPGARISSETDVTIFGEYLSEASGIEFQAPAVKATILSAAHNAIRARFTVSGEALEDRVTFRVLTPRGPSNLLGFRVSSVEHQPEIEPNGTASTAQQLQWPIIVNGVVNPDEDSDFYRISVAAGETLRLQVITGQIGSGLRSQLYLLEEDRRRIAAAAEKDGRALLDHRFTRGGNYFLIVRSAMFPLTPEFPTGHAAFVYQLQIAPAAELRSVVPACWTPGGSPTVSLLGHGLQSVRQLRFSHPGVSARVIRQENERIEAQISVPRDMGPVRLWGSSGSGDLGPAQAVIDTCLSTRDKAFDLPFRAEGVIAKAKQIDRYRFEATEGVRYHFEVEVGRSGSPLDSFLTIKDSAGKVIAENDDGPSAVEEARGDSVIDFTPSQSGPYSVEVRQSFLDLAGPEYGYRLHGRRARSGIAVIARGDSGLPLEHASAPDRIFVKPGGAAEVLLTVVWLEGFEKTGAEICASIEGLPPEVEVKPSCVSPKEGKYSDQKNKSGLFRADTSITVRASGKVPVGMHRVRIVANSKGTDPSIDAVEQLRVRVMGRYVLSSLAGFESTLNDRILVVSRPPAFYLRPEAGYELYPFQLSLRGGATKILPISALSEAGFPSGLEIESDSLPRGVRIARVEEARDLLQYLVHLEAQSDCDKGWFPLVSFSAVDRTTGQRVFTRNIGVEVR